MKIDIVCEKIYIDNQSVININNSILSQFVAKSELCNKHGTSAAARE